MLPLRRGVDGGCSRRHHAGQDCDRQSRGKGAADRRCGPTDSRGPSRCGAREDRSAGSRPAWRRRRIGRPIAPTRVEFVPNGQGLDVGGAIPRRRLKPGVKRDAVFNRDIPTQPREPGAGFRPRQVDVQLRALHRVRHRTTCLIGAKDDADRVTRRRRGAQSLGPMP